ncbi:hypothetical protein WDU94_010808 [Cyamophila willieti]
MGEVATTIQNGIDSTVTNMGVTLSKIDQLADQLGSTSFEVTQFVDQAVSSVASMVSGMVQGTVLIYDFIIDVMIAWMEKSWRVVGVGIVRFLSKLFCSGTELYQLVMQYGREIGHFIEQLFQDETPRVQYDPDDQAVTLVGILIGMVGTMTGVVMDVSPGRYAGFFDGLARRLTATSGVSYLFMVLRYVQTIFKTVKELIMYALGYANPEAEALRLLSRDKEFIARFVHEAQLITSEVNTMLVNNPIHRRRYWETVLQAYKIQKVLAQAPTNVVSLQLSKLVTDVIAKGNEKFLDLSASPVRFEPMVIYVTGASGIGKSFMTEALVDILLARTNTQGMSTEKIFYRTAGERFWSGYRNQPVVVYDEWLNTRDATRCMDQLFEMMKLKSTSMFIPEMAHLEEKRIRANPLIVIVLCNDAFPTNLGDYVTCSEASLRRRELVLHAERVPEFEGVDYRQATAEQRADIKAYKHLQFGSYRDVRKFNSLSSIRKDFPTMAKWVADQWLNYWNRETENVRLRMQRLPHYAETITGPLSVRDPFSMFYQIDSALAQDTDVVQNTWTPWEQLEEAIRVTSQLLNREVIDTVEEVELIPWELAQPPTVQVDVLGAAIQVVNSGFGLRTILNATRRQLMYWEESVAQTQIPPSECCICLTDQPCIYECKDSMNALEPHRICADCYRTNLEIGSGNCPLCRSHNMGLMNYDEQLRTMGFFCRTVAMGMLTAKDVVNKLLHYYRYRDQHPIRTSLLDTMLDICEKCLFFGRKNSVCRTMGKYQKKVGGRRYLAFTEETLAKALSERAKGVSLRILQEKYGIPRSTIDNKFKNRHSKKIGGQLSIDPTDEDTIARNIVTASQELDPDCKAIKEQLDTDLPNPLHSVKNGTLFQRKSETRKWKVLVPVPLILAVIQHFHDNPLASNPGESVTFDLISKHHYWNKTDIKNFVRTCEVCARNNNKNGTNTQSTHRSMGNTRAGSNGPLSPQ